MIITRIPKYLIILFFVIFLSCTFKNTGNINSKNIKTFYQASSDCYFAFRSVKNADEAKSALKKYRDIIEEYQNEKIEELDYNMAFMDVYVRLYIIENYKGNHTKADEYLRLSAEYISEGKKMSESDFIEWKGRIISFYKEMEENIRWMKEIEHAGSGG